MDSACCSLSQEESQREIQSQVKEEREVIVMYSKTTDVVNCTSCGKQGHTSEKCSTIVGYPPTHPKYRGKGRETHGRKPAENTSKEHKNGAREEE